jgi:aspartyl-tRNA(Asn)/glutamyl-tRNA(Gln) amidotransferase subunit A
MSGTENVDGGESASSPPRDDIVGRLRRGEVSSVSLTEEYLARIAEYDGAIGAFFEVTGESARERAAWSDEALQRGRSLGPLHGVPIAVKDNIDTEGVVTSVGSSFFAHNVPKRDAEVVRRLRAAGAVLLGKLALHEFAYGGTSQNSHHTNCHNPWDLTRIPGGSSGGSGAALAADLCAGALGTDTGGSVRGPAALNGVSALRPTYGRISGRGVFPITWSLDTVGPMARSVADIAAMLEVLAGFDEEDLASERAPVDAYEASVALDPAGIRVGLPTTFYFDEVDHEIVSLVHDAGSVLERLGCEVVPVDISGAAEVEEATRRMIGAEALAIHRERLAAHPEGFGEDVRRRLRSADQISGADYATFVRLGREWRRQLREVFERVDVLLSPTAGVVAPPIATSEMIETTRLLTRLTYGWSLAGLPALALPCGFSRELPVGMQLAARPWAETTLLTVGAAYQRETDWHTHAPVLTAADVSATPPPRR